MWKKSRSFIKLKILINLLRYILLLQVLLSLLFPKKNLPQKQLVTTFQWKKTPINSGDGIKLINEKNINFK